MFEFLKKKSPPSTLDQLIYALYGNPPPPKRADVRKATSLAFHELLGETIPETEVAKQAEDLNSGPIPYTTYDLALSVALAFFKRSELVAKLQGVQLIARLQTIQWLQEKSVHPQIAGVFEDTLYKMYKPTV